MGENIANGGDGGDSSLTNSITGGAATSFTLSQTAIGGNGGRAHLKGSLGGAGGNANSSLTFANSLGGDVVGTSAAVGGNGGGEPEITFSEGTGGDGGTAHAQLILIRQEVSLLRFQSLAVMAAAPLRVPLVGKGLMYLLIPVRSMPPLRPGILLSSMLRRVAVMEVAPRHGVPGQGGDATVSVSKTASVSSFTIETTASGGDGGSDLFGFNPHCGDGGLANAVTNVSNAGGSVHAMANAMGGNGGSARERWDRWKRRNGYVRCARHHDRRFCSRSL